MIQDVVSFSDSLCSGKCVRCRIILPLYYFPVSVCHSPLCLRCGAGVCCHSAPPRRPCGAGAAAAACGWSPAQLCLAAAAAAWPGWSRNLAPHSLFLLTLGSHVQVIVWAALPDRSVPWCWDCLATPQTSHPLCCPVSFPDS